MKQLASKTLKLAVALAAASALHPGIASAQHYTQTNLVADTVGAAAVQDPNLVNPWGLTRSASSPWWVSDNNSGVSTLYTGAGAIVPINGNGIVAIPRPRTLPPALLPRPRASCSTAAPASCC